MEIKNGYINPKIPFLGHLWTHSSKGWVVLLKRMPLKKSYKLCIVAHTCKTSAGRLRHEACEFETSLCDNPCQKELKKMSYTFKF